MTKRRAHGTALSHALSNTPLNRTFDGHESGGSEDAIAKQDAILEFSSAHTIPRHGRGGGR